MVRDDLAEEMEGVEITTSEPKHPLFTEQERRILEMYDRLEELQLEIALLKARGVLSQDEPMEASEGDIKKAQQELLRAKAAYQVRNNTIEGVLVANPILKAVHAGINASPAEQDLLPLIEHRDKLSVALTGLSAKVSSTRSELMMVESEHAIKARENARLSSRMLALAEEANTQKKEDITDSKLRLQLDQLEGDVKTSRQRWRIMKGTASGTIVGSGVDWARDPKLLGIVLDDDGAEG
ncbi:hypothetical protein LHYA1_G004561 [Lachnellula hyalina]|uniref:Centromere protein H C-terminal domain-containing protein n=1 Tax=Lachnellula hyalina TaxID=1316788 RepID=A0A8H8R196_9HELO|nr:uncharacterized protein LHYA1_G004561 [Lachnellula hyalina]TVY25821.1 hypothetical protein LHYA1_G004561 [Lachnellula hyalina]